MQTTPAEIAHLLGGRLMGEGQRTITRLTTLQAADAASVSFLSNPRYRSQLALTQAGCVILAERVLPLAEGECAGGGVGASLVVLDDPYLGYARLSQWWAAQLRPPASTGIHPSAVIEAGARIHPEASVGPFSHVAAGATIGQWAVVGPRCSIGVGASIGAHTRLAPGVTVLDACSVGERCIVHSGVVIGADGFGFAPAAGEWVKIAQLGAVRIGDDVEIGANTCIDRGALEDTVIGDGVKLDNLVQIGHNAQVGAHTAMAGCVGVAGSARIGAHCSIGGGAVVLGHLTLADGVHVSAFSIVTRSITQPGLYTGLFPIDDNASWEKNAATLKQLHGLRERLKRLEAGLSSPNSKDA